MVDLASLRASPVRARVLMAAAEAGLRGRAPMAPDRARVLARLPRPGLDPAALAADRAEALVQLATAQATLAELEAEAQEGEPVDTAEVAAEAARARAQSARSELSVARQRMAGAAISACGMAIVVAAAGWSPLWHAAPVLLVVLFASDLRAASRSAGEARRTAEAAALTLRDHEQRELPERRRRPAEELARSRAVARQLVEEARAELARAERGLADLGGWLGLESDDPGDIAVAAQRLLGEAEYARRSLAWYEARQAVEATAPR